MDDTYGSAPVTVGELRTLILEVVRAELAAIRGSVMDTGTAAIYVGLAKQTMYNHRSQGTGPTAHKHGRKTVYYAADLDSWLAKRIASAE
ncbi:helix-turn-helix domain-containing protein [Agromyces badenianii]|uniref:helix-turn-helix domain-containing protein n=1 Tax=Agromyces badenianii TaxID=2080742 RepID=UPI0014046144|nr:helix-turn-helix domain-containing protein [Agromyces badenianii]